MREEHVHIPVRELLDRLPRAVNGLPHNIRLNDKVELVAVEGHIDDFAVYMESSYSREFSHSTVSSGHKMPEFIARWLFKSWGALQYRP